MISHYIDIYTLFYSYSVVSIWYPSPSTRLSHEPEGAFSTRLRNAQTASTLRHDCAVDLVHSHLGSGVLWAFATSAVATVPGQPEDGRAEDDAEGREEYDAGGRVEDDADGREEEEAYRREEDELPDGRDEFG